MHPIDRFSTKFTITESGCWEWQNGVSKNGYATFWCNGKQHQAHRWIYEQVVEKVPTDLHIDHLCTNKICVNPDHLEPVTPAINVMRNSLRRHEEMDHEYTPYWKTDDKSQCKICKSRSDSDRYAKNKARAAVSSAGA